MKEQQNMHLRLGLLAWLQILTIDATYVNNLQISSLHKYKGGQTAILVHWSAAQRTTEMLTEQRTGKNSGPAPVDYRN
jgi:hypothetical protein